MTDKLHQWKFFEVCRPEHEGGNCAQGQEEHTMKKSRRKEWKIRQNWLVNSQNIH